MLAVATVRFAVLPPLTRTMKAVAPAGASQATVTSTSGTATTAELLVSPDGAARTVTPIVAAALAPAELLAVTATL